MYRFLMPQTRMRSELLPVGNPSGGVSLATVSWCLWKEQTVSLWVRWWILPAWKASHGRHPMSFRRYPRLPQLSRCSGCRRGLTALPGRLGQTMVLGTFFSLGSRLCAQTPWVSGNDYYPRNTAVLPTTTHWWCKRLRQGEVPLKLGQKASATR